MCTVSLQKVFGIRNPIYSCSISYFHFFRSWFFFVICIKLKAVSDRVWYDPFGFQLFNVA